MSRAGDPPIPVVDLARQHAGLIDDLMSAVREVVERQEYVLGTALLEFEQAVAELVRVRHAVGVGNGTDALYLALRALEIEAGDEVITSPFTFFATAGSIVNAGARPVFVDIESDTLNLDAGSVAAAITDRARAIIPVHLFGQMADMAAILWAARESGLTVIEDAAQAIGAWMSIDGERRMAGAAGAVACFSFYPTKNLGAWGDAGLLTTDDDALAERLRRIRTHGREPGGGYVHHEVGVNSRLDTLQAAVLRVKLRHLSSWTEARRANAARYRERLEGVGDLRLPPERADRFHVYHHYTIRTAHRDALRAHLAGRGIGSAVYYPLPLHLQPCFASLGYREGDLPEAERAAREVLSIPVGPELTPAEIDRVASAIEGFFAGPSRAGTRT